MLDTSHPTMAPDQAETGTARPGRPAAPPWLRQLVLRLHFYAGLLVGPFILVAAVTGGLYVFTPQLERVVHRSVVTVPATEHQVPLSAQMQAAVAAHRQNPHVAAVRPATRPGDTTRVLFDDPGLGESERTAVFVNPGSGAVTGELTVYGSSGSLPVRAWLDSLHRDLHLGTAGRWYSELAASWLWVVAAGGLVLWWSRVRRRHASWSAMRQIVGTPQRTPARGSLVARHAALGTWLLPCLLFLSATGLTWSQYAGENVTSLRERLGWQTPAVSTSASPASAAHAEHMGHAAHGMSSGAALGQMDDVVAAARRAGIDSQMIEVSIPSKPGGAWKVAEYDRRWPTQVDAVALDPHTLAVSDRADFATFPLAAKLAQWGIAAHMGVLFGLANQVLLAAVAACLVLTVIRGYRMWWRRRPTRGRMPQPIPRGALRRAPLWAVIMLGAGAALVGWFLPLLGISLVGFLIIDVLLGARQQVPRSRVS